MKSTLFALFDASQVMHAHTHHRELMDKDGTILLSPGLEASCSLGALGYAHRRCRNIYRHLDNKTIRDAARFFSRFWFEQEHINQLIRAGQVFEYKGYPLMVMLHAHLRGWFAESIISVQAMDGILAQFMPERVICYDSEPVRFTYWHDPSFNLEPTALVSLAEARGIAVTRLKMKSPVPVNGQTAPLPETSRAERLRMDIQWSQGIGKVLIISHAFFYFDQFIPIMEQLVADGFSLQVLFHEALTEQQQGILGKLNIPAVSSQAYLDDASRNRHTVRHPEADAVYTAMAEKSQIREFFATPEGIPFWEVIKGRLKHLLLEDLPDCLLRIDAAEMMMADFQPDLVFSGLDQVSHDTPWVLAAGRRGIRTMVYQHGIWNNDAVDQLTFASEMICAMGPGPVRHAVDRFHLDETRITATGYPFFEGLYGRAIAPDPSTLRSQICLDPNRPVGLFLGAMGWVWGPDCRHSESTVLQSLLDLLKEMPELTLIVRMHSGDQVHAMYPTLQRFGARVKLNPDFSLKELLAVSNVVITQQTTAGLEAVCAGRPLVYLNIASERDTFPFARSGAAVGVYKPGALAATVRRVLTDNKTRELMNRYREPFLEDQVYGLDGSATKRISHLCREMIEKNGGQVTVGASGERFGSWIERTALFHHTVAGLPASWRKIIGYTMNNSSSCAA